MKPIAPPQISLPSPDNGQKIQNSPKPVAFSPSLYPASLPLGTLTRPDVSRVARKIGWMQGRTTAACPDGMLRSSDAADADLACNPKGRRPFARRRCRSSSMMPLHRILRASRRQPKFQASRPRQVLLESLILQYNLYLENNLYRQRPPHQTGELRHSNKT